MTQPTNGRPQTAPGVPNRIGLARVVSIDLDEPLPALATAGDQNLLVLVRQAGQPIGMVFGPAEDLGATAGLTAAVQRHLADQLDPPRDDRIEPHRPSGQDATPAISVIICTRDRADDLRRCLDSLRNSAYRRFEIVVVDNAPKTDAAATVCAEFRSSDEPPVRYFLEARPGLSRARNTGVRSALHDLIAFVDDDEEVDPGWLAALASEFEAQPRLGCVSGLVLPAALETQAQVEFEQFGGHSKGRGFRRELFDADYLKHVQPAIYPLPPFGVGANMAFRRQALADIGGFDIGLGAGTPTQGAEDTHAFAELLLAGWLMVYTPNALTWHHHRRDRASLVEQLSGYGVGLGAYFTAILMRDPRRLFALIRLIPRVARDLLRPDSARNAPMTEMPPDLDGLSLARVLLGAHLYLRSRWRLSREGRTNGSDVESRRPR